MSVFFEALGFGLVTAAIIALAAVGLTLQISVTNFVNFAYGDLITLGAYLAYAVNIVGVPFPLAVAIGAVALAALAVLANKVIFEPFVRGRARVVTLLMVTLGLSFIVQNVMLIIWGPQDSHYVVPLGATVQFGPFVLTQTDFVLIIGSVLLLAGLHFFLQYTRFGKALRATSNNAELAAACGINTKQVINWTWAASGFFAAVAGVGLVLETNVLTPTAGFNQLFLIFGAIILGGIGRIYGAMLGALVIGLGTELSGMYFNAAYKTAVAFLIVVLVLLLRPQGIFSARGRSA